MLELRTPKDVTGIELGIPNLTLRAWYEASFGRRAWQQIEKVPPQVWRKYLDWYRDVLEIPVENNVEVTSIESGGDHLRVQLRHANRIEWVHARKVVLATGFDGNGAWRAPRALVARLPPERYAHAADEIDFRRFRGLRVGVLGAGASAFDNAAAALEAGAASVDLCFRRTDIPRSNPFVWLSFAGMLGHFPELPELERWRFMRHILEERPLPPPQDTFWRCRRFENFSWHPNCTWHAIHNGEDTAVVETEAATFNFEFIIFATGVETDLSTRPELAQVVQHIALWRDRFSPPPGEESAQVGAHPYLGTAFEFTERKPGTAPFLARLHNFTFGAMPSLGLTGASIVGLRYGVPRLVRGLVRDLFREDATAHYGDLIKYSEPELETLEPALAWVERLATEAISARKLIDDLDPTLPAQVLGHEPAAQTSKAGRKGSRAPRSAASTGYRSSRVMRRGFRRKF
jgi:cation diffusion facilitator CzcD-associated flavoprotein CzcO